MCSTLKLKVAEADNETDISRKTFEEVDRHLFEHLYVGAEHRETADYHHQLDSNQKDAQRSNLPGVIKINQDNAGYKDHVPLQSVLPSTDVVIDIVSIIWKISLTTNMQVKLSMDQKRMSHQFSLLYTSRIRSQ